MMKQSAFVILLLSLLHHACGFLALDAPALNRRSPTRKGSFQRVLTLRGGDEKPPATSTKPTQAAGLSAILMVGAQTYSKYLESNPIATKSVTACLIFAVSDTLAQMIEGKKSEERDLKRTFAASLIGLLYFGPAAHFWYENIFRLLPGT